MSLSDNITTVKGVGPVVAEHLAKLGIERVGDLIDHWPRRYDDYSNLVPIADLAPGLVAIKAKITGVSGRYGQRGRHVTEAHAVDGTGRVKLVWFNQPYRAAAIKATSEYLISGKYDISGRQLVIANPSLEMTGEATPDSGRILAVYPETKGLTSAQLRKFIRYCRPQFAEIQETLPAWLLAKAKLISRSDALWQLHTPGSSSSLQAARQRLSFEELFQLQLASALFRADQQLDQARPINFDEQVARDFIARLPFKLTDDQKRTVWQIYQDMSRPTPMNRLVEGDVGSGKTVVAAMAALMVLHSGRQVLLMAPTEILARQHASTIVELLSHTPWSGAIGLLLGSLSAKAKSQLQARIKDGSCRLVIGTHALLQDKVVTSDVGLVIVDEQHRFGVAQRQKLKQIGGLCPHLLTMTATPIPRTLALTLYGELNLSMIKSKPAGRQQIDTRLIPFSARHSAYQLVDEQLAVGRQAFVVAPLISQSAVLQTAAAEALAEDLQKRQLKHRRIGLLHGKMKADDKDRIMRQFAEHQLDVLVATTVIEVGVNVPNATVMVVEGAERFGLAQLHQLRGRVGRGAHQAYCLVIPSQDAAISRRLQALTTTTDGFRLAELDLDLRGPGAIYGIRQSGALDLRIADLNDRGMVQQAKTLAEEFIARRENIANYHWLAARVRHFQSVTRLN